jgi:hypothetical protein
MIPLLSSVCTMFIMSQTPADLYNQGNELYASGDYQAAIESYEQAVSQIHNATLYYNLGNSYFKTGKFGKALLNYRRAWFLTPRDADIVHNISFTRTYRADKIQTNPGPLAKIVYDMFHVLSFHEARTASALFFLLLSGFVSLYIVFRKSWHAYCALACGIVCLFLFINWQVWSHERTSRPAIITAPEVNALSGPGKDYKTIMVIHDGTEVRIRQTRSEYALIHLPGGLGGWVELSSLEEVY